MENKKEIGCQTDLLFLWKHPPRASPERSEGNPSSPKKPSKVYFRKHFANKKESVAKPIGFSCEGTPLGITGAQREVTPHRPKSRRKFTFVSILQTKKNRLPNRLAFPVKAPLWASPERSGGNPSSPKKPSKVYFRKHAANKKEIGCQTDLLFLWKHPPRASPERSGGNPSSPTGKEIGCQTDWLFPVKATPLGITGAQRR